MRYRVILKNGSEIDLEAAFIDVGDTVFYVVGKDSSFVGVFNRADTIGVYSMDDENVHNIVADIDFDKCMNSGSFKLGEVLKQYNLEKAEKKKAEDEGMCQDDG